MFRNVGIVEIIIIVFLIVLLFGTKKVPEFMKSIGEAIREFKKAVKGKD